MRYEQSIDSSEKLGVAPQAKPPVESLLDPALAAEAWPEAIAKNEAFLTQIRERQELSACLSDMITSIPNPEETVEEALTKGQITVDQARKLYDSLSGVLGDDEYRRLVLYLPLEFIPRSSWEPESAELKESTDKFRESYLTAWNGMLTTHDVRANFVDGDVMEIERRTGDLPRVVKAAHLIPKLVEAGLIDVPAVVALFENTPDMILRESIASTLPVLSDLGLLQESDISLMAASHDPQLKFIASSIPKERDAEARLPEVASSVSLLDVESRLKALITEAEQADYGDVTDGRKRWLKETRIQTIIGELASQVGESLAAGKLSGDISSELADASVEAATKELFINSIREAVTTLAKVDQTSAARMYQSFSDSLRRTAEVEDEGARASLSKALRHFHSLGVVTRDELARFGVSLPKLAGPFSENLEFMSQEMTEIEDIAHSLENDPDLTPLIYPTVLVYGSRLKGYGEGTSDIDVGVFVRPDVSFEEQTRLEKLIKEKFDHKDIHGYAVEFWLDDEGDQLKVRDFPSRTGVLGDSSWTYILFGAAWAGDKKVVRELQGKLLPSYFSSKEKEIRGREARGLYLEEMERDTLLYRLLHKGYERFFPRSGGLDTPHSDAVDGGSVFWDSGYRRLATQLFANRVFLPKI